VSTQGYEVVIIGGGAVGCGVAYSLARAGITDVLLIEKQPTVAAVTTSQAAGLVGQVRNTVARTQLAMWSVETFRELQLESDHKPSWSEVGSLRIALSDKRASEFEHMKSVADESGLQAEFIDKQTAEGMWPLMRLDGATAIL
jgi:glycine/D-amino acid oxidase-like deaminating enzyme